MVEPHLTEVVQHAPVELERVAAVQAVVRLAVGVHVGGRQVGA